MSPEGDRLFGDAEAAAQAFEQSPMIMLVTDGPELKTVAYNAAVRAVVHDRLVYGQPILEGFSKELGGQGFAEAYGIPTATGETVTLNEFRVQVHQPDGTVHELFLDAVFAPRFDDDGRPRGTIVIATDVTQRVRDREAAEREFEQLRLLYDAARGSVRAMQRALLADSVPVLPTFDVAARYLLASDEQAAGGDWFDAVAREDGTLVLVVGDVVGHGQAAAVAMGQLRSVLLAQLRAGKGISEAVTFLDGFASTVPDARRATVCVLSITEDGDIEYCTAGHPPPLIISADEADSRYLEPSGAGPLGAGSVFRTGAARAEVGDSVVLYSDGLLERPSTIPASASLELLATASNAHRNLLMPAGAPRSAAERIASLTIELLTRLTGHTDDITVLAVQRRVAHAPFDLELSTTPDAPALARAALRGWLDDLGATSDDADVLVHATSELVDNVIDHAYGDARDESFFVHARCERDGAVVVEVVDHGTWKPPITNHGRGRGLALVRLMMDELEFEKSEAGTTARIRRNLTRPAGLLERSQQNRKLDPEHFDVWSDGGTEPVVTVTGPFDSKTADDVVIHLNLALTEARSTVVVDLTFVSLLASSGVNQLFRVIEQAAPLQVNVVLIAPSGSPAQHVLELVGLPYQQTPTHPDVP